MQRFNYKQRRSFLSRHANMSKGDAGSTYSGRNAWFGDQERSMAFENTAFGHRMQSVALRLRTNATGERPGCTICNRTNWMMTVRRTFSRQHTRSRPRA